MRGEGSSGRPPGRLAGGRKASPGAVRREVWRAALCLALLAASCKADYREPRPATSSESALAAIGEEPSRFAGQTVTLEGVFMGWRAIDCRFPASAGPPLTRSDWLIQAGQACLYVTGGLPAGLDPMDPEGVGRRIELQAQVMHTVDGKVYLAYLDARPLGP